MIQQGYIAADCETDLMNVNAKISIAFREKEFENMIRASKFNQLLPQTIIDWGTKRP